MPANTHDYVNKNGPYFHTIYFSTLYHTLTDFDRLEIASFLKSKKQVTLWEGLAKTSNLGKNLLFNLNTSSYLDFNQACLSKDARIVNNIFSPSTWNSFSWKSWSSRDFSFDALSKQNITSYQIENPWCTLAYKKGSDIEFQNTFYKRTSERLKKIQKRIKWRLTPRRSQTSSVCVTGFHAESAFGRGKRKSLPNPLLVIKPVFSFINLWRLPSNFKVIVENGVSSCTPCLLGSVELRVPQSSRDSLKLFSADKLHTNILLTFDFWCRCLSHFSCGFQVKNLHSKPIVSICSSLFTSC